MFESVWDVVRYAVAGAAGGLIYWGVRQHGVVFTHIWSRLTQR